jgi:pyruvate decarboxylase
MTIQDISSMLRYGYNPIIFLINNDGLTIEVEIHDGEYNNIQPWDYCAVVQGFKGRSDAKLLTARATTEAELVAAIEAAKAAPDHLAFIEFVVDRDDCSRELLEWGSRVAAANGRAPDPR